MKMKEETMEFAKRLDHVTGSAIRDIFSLLAQPGMISFAGGNPSPDSFPTEDVAAISDRLIREKGAHILQYGRNARHYVLEKGRLSKWSKSAASKRHPKK